MPGWFQGAHEAPSKPSKPRRSRTMGPQCEKTSAANSPDERTMLIARWRRITRLPLPTATGIASLAHVPKPTGHGPNLGDAANLLAACEWLLRRRLRQDWALLPGTGRAQVLTWVSQVKRDAPVVKATASAADAAAWTRSRCIGAASVTLPGCSISPCIRRPDWCDGSVSFMSISRPVKGEKFKRSLRTI